MSVRSPSGVPVPSTGSLSLATGRLSPVSADSATSSVAARSSVCHTGPPSPGASADAGAPAGTVTCPPRASAVGRYWFGRGHTAALGQVDGDAEEQRARSQEVGGPVDPEAVTGVAGVDDE